MRRGLQVMVVALVGASLWMGSSAFSKASFEPRTVTASVVGDGSAYLALSANPTSPHKCFVGESGGKKTVTFASIGEGCGASGTGTGINAGDGATDAKYAKYAFHDLLLITNKGTGSVRVWVNATTTSGSLSQVAVATKTTSGAMVDADYGTAQGPHVLAVGDSIYLGVRVNAGKLTTGSVTGNIVITANAS